MNKYSSRSVLLLLAVVLVVGCGGGGGEEAAAPAAAPAAPAPSAGSATVQGTINYSNGDPDTVIKMDADPVCLSLHADGVHTEQIVTDGAGHLGNVFVYVKEGISGSMPAPSEPQLLNQIGCQYTPHVSGIQVNQKLVIRNSDPTLHNVHALPQKNEEFNQGQPFEGMELERTFSKPEVMVRFKCDVHPWMSSYIGVVNHPYFAVSAENGSYSIGNLPAGDYVIEAWHETLGTQTQSVTVGDGAAVDLSFDFQPLAS